LSNSWGWVVWQIVKISKEVHAIWVLCYNFTMTDNNVMIRRNRTLLISRIHQLNSYYQYVYDYIVISYIIFPVFIIVEIVIPSLMFKGAIEIRCKKFTKIYKDMKKNIVSLIFLIWIYIIKISYLLYKFVHLLKHFKVF